MTPSKLKVLSSSSWNEKYQPNTIAMTRDKYTGRYHLGSNSIFAPDTFTFKSLISAYFPQSD